MAAFVEGGGVSLDKYRRVSSRVPLPLKFDDHSQASHPPGSTMVLLVTASCVSLRFYRSVMRLSGGNATVALRAISTQGFARPLGKPHR